MTQSTSMAIMHLSTVVLELRWTSMEVVANHLELTTEKVSNWFKNRAIKDAKKAKKMQKIKNRYEMGFYNVNISSIQELDEKVKSMMTKSQNIPYGNICTVCGKEGMNTRTHIEANHLAGVAIPCIFCGNVFKSRQTLGEHRRKFHM